MKPTLLNKSIFRIIAVFFAVIPFVGLGQYSNTATITTTGAATYTVPAGITCLQVQIWGGGGAGGGNAGASDGGGGGGGGGYTFALVPVNPGDVINLNVGAGGLPVNLSQGGTGGTSWFVASGSYSAAGGQGGFPPVSGNGGLGGAGGVGSTYSGGAGGVGRDNGDGDGGGGGSSAGTGSNGNNGNAGSGGSNPQQGGAAVTGGGAGGNGGNGDASSGTAGTAPGGGGGGAGSGFSGGAGGNGQIIVTPVNICDTYCTSSFSANTTGSISNVSFSTISNPTGWAGYTNYTSNCTTVTTGSSNTLTVTIAGSSYVNHVWAYFDWNSDGDFSDAGEAVDLGQVTGSGSLTATINIPVGATLGNTVMRIITSYNNDPTSGCYSATYGETEDYCVTITGCTTTIPAAGADQNLLSCVNSTSLAGNAVGAGETGTWTLMSGSGTITSPNSPTSGITNLGPGANVFRWTIQSANPACPDLYDEVTINTLNLSTVSNAGVDTETCNSSIALSANAPGGGETGLWSVAPAGPTILPINSNTATISGMAPTTAYTLTWTITNGLCPSSDNVVITTIAGVTAANAGSDQLGLCTGGSVNLAGNNPANGVGTWTGASGIIADPSSPTTAVNALNTAGSYTYTWTVSAPGCVSSVDQVVLTVAFCDPNITTITCPAGSAVFSDGGATYANNEHIVQKYCPSTPGTYITAVFSQMTMGTSADHMIVLNGANYGAPIIDDFYSLPTINGGANTITSSAADGCLTFIFLSNGTTNAAGWTANISCTATAGTGNVAQCNATNCLGGCLRTICGIPATVPFTGDGVGAEELNAVDGGCLAAGETCSNWFLINPTNAGTLTLNMFVNAGQDQDFAVWEAYDPLLECPAMTGDAPILCNFAGATAQGTGFNSVTQALPNAAYGPTLNISAAQITAGVYYIILVNTYNNGGACPQPDVSITFGGTAGLSCNPPIALGDEDILLAGSAEGNMNHLTWQVESETTISSYTIEKSKDGSEWTTVGVRSSNKSMDGSEYFMYDEQPYSPFTYYRVTGYTTDGQEKSSNIISVSKGDLGDYWVSELFPNPTSDEVSFQYQGKNFNELVTVVIYNSIGQVVLTESIDVNQMKGITLKTDALANGTYQVKISQGEQKMMKKLSIIR